MDTLDPSAPWSWNAARAFLPFDLDGLAVESGALQRRRGVAGGESLLRTLLLYGLPKSTLQLSSRLARDANLAHLSPVALFKRLKKAEPLLSSTFIHLLSHSVEPEIRFGSYRLLSVDATALCGPGATGIDQRLHVLYDLGKGLPVSVDLTDWRGAETLGRHDCLGCGDLVLGDRGYATRRSLTSGLRSGARLLVRFEFENLRLTNDLEEKIWSEQASGCVADSGPTAICVYLPEWPAPLRAIGERNPKGEVVWLLTDLGPDELPLNEARKLYARRWQIELFFKRLKSLLDLDELPTRDGPMTRPWIWAKLILAALAVLMAHERFSPWGSPFQGKQVEGVPVRLSRAHGSASGPQASPSQARSSQMPPPSKSRPKPNVPMATAGGLS